MNFFCFSSCLRLCPEMQGRPTIRFSASEAELEIPCKRDFVEDDDRILGDTEELDNMVIKLPLLSKFCMGVGDPEGVESGEQSRLDPLNILNDLGVSVTVSMSTSLSSPERTNSKMHYLFG